MYAVVLRELDYSISATHCQPLFRKAIMNIYNNVKKIADRKGISIRQLEIKAGIGNGTIRRWGEISPSVDNLIKVANALGVYPERLLK